MTCDLMGSMQRAWLCAGNGYLIDDTLDGEDDPYLLVPEDERPILALPPGRSGREYEIMFGWAMIELVRLRLGWLAVLRHVMRLGDAA